LIKDSLEILASPTPFHPTEEYPPKRSIVGFTTILVMKEEA